MNRILQTVLLVVSTLIILTLVLELLVFRFLFLPAELPKLAQNSGGVLKFESQQRGTYRIQNEISAEFRINQSGWNSGHKSYDQRRSAETNLVAVIGDSYIEALQVGYDQSVAEVLERKLIEEGRDIRVYRFGLSGSPLSQYLYILENEVLKYYPELVVINLVHNDFLESLGKLEGSYTDSFATFRFLSNTSLEEIPPQPYVRNVVWYIKQSAIFRYFYVRKQAVPNRIKNNILRFFNKKKSRFQSQYSANVTDSVSYDNRVNRIIDYSFNRIKNLSESKNFEVLVLIDGDRDATVTALTAGSKVQSPALVINRKVVESARLHNLPVIDLQPIVESDYISNMRRFNFRSDGHWNEYMHSLVANEIRKWINGHSNLFD